MITNRIAWLSASLLCLLLTGGGNRAVAAQGPELTLEVKLIWGTNDPSSPNPKHKKLDSTLTKWLASTFKWKNYFEVDQQVVTIPLHATKPVSLSDACKLDVKYLGGSRVEVALYGHGKKVSTVAHTLPQNDRLVIAGDDKNDTAWFIAFKILQTKSK